MSSPRTDLARPESRYRIALALPDGRARWGGTIAAVVLAVALTAGTASAQSWTFEPGIHLQETLTNNVNLVPSDLAKSDLVSEITPTLRFTEKGARTSLVGDIALQGLLYARTGEQNNQIYPLANILGNAELVDRFFYVEGAIVASQQFFNPFGPTPADIASATNNRYTSTLYRISPYIQGTFQGGTTYLLRNNSIWSNLSGAPISTNDSYASEWVGKLENPGTPLGWTADLDLQTVKFNNQGSQVTNLARIGPRYSIDPQLLVRASVGYEDNQYPLSSSQGAIYGIGLEWHPTERTSVVANLEHRFFGASYLFTFDHRTPLSVWSINASRNITSYPQQLAALPAGNVQGLLNQLLLSRIPDPTQRQTAVDTLIQSQGLPVDLLNPVNLYTQQIVLADSVSATMGLLGARNSMFLQLFYLHQEPIAGSGNALPPIFGNSTNNTTQQGASYIWTHNLTESVTMDLTISGNKSQLNSPLVGHTNQGSVRLGITAPISARTNVFAGARYQVSRSDIAVDYNEAAIFAGLTYTFK
jgi:uncharacterized protein (PEP-CTERM system associated)